MAAVRPIPDGFHSLTPHLTVKDAAKAIAWYKASFGAEELARSEVPGAGTIMHASRRVGDSMLMLNDEFPQSEALGPGDDHRGIAIHLYVDDVDAVFTRSIENGAREVFPVMDTFWGDRYGKLIDPFGHHWSIATRKEDLTPAQVEERANQYFSQAKS